MHVFENRVHRRIFGSKRHERAGGWRRLCNVVLHNLYSSADVIRMIKSRRVRWMAYVVHMGDVSNACRISIG
jgi:hypothetical protein